MEVNIDGETQIETDKKIHLQFDFFRKVQEINEVSQGHFKNDVQNNFETNIKIFKKEFIRNSEILQEFGVERKNDDGDESYKEFEKEIMVDSEVEIDKFNCNIEDVIFEEVQEDSDVDIETIEEQLQPEFKKVDEKLVLEYDDSNKEIVNFRSK